MANNDERLYEYAVVRYLPRVDREEFINIGLLMMCKRRKWLRGEIRLNSSRICSFDPRADLKSLEKQASLFCRTDVPTGELPVEERYRWLTAVKSAVLQVSPSHPGLLCRQPVAGDTSDLDREFMRLLNDLVD